MPYFHGIHRALTAQSHAATLLCYTDSDFAGQTMCSPVLWAMIVSRITKKDIAIAHTRVTEKQQTPCLQTASGAVACRHVSNLTEHARRVALIFKWVTPDGNPVIPICSGENPRQPAPQQELETHMWG